MSPDPSRNGVGHGKHDVKFESDVLAQTETLKSIVYEVMFTKKDWGSPSLEKKAHPGGRTVVSSRSTVTLDGSSGFMIGTHTYDFFGRYRAREMEEFNIKAYVDNLARRLSYDFGGGVITENGYGH